MLIDCTGQLLCLGFLLNIIKLNRNQTRIGLGKQCEDTGLDGGVFR